MPDDADELILKMQHLEAQARAQEEARAKQGRSDKLKSKAQQMAFEAQQEVSAAEEELRKAGGQQTEEARDAKTRAVKARARLNFALDQMDEAERAEWEALRAEARAEAHGQLADDPMFKKT